MPGESPPPAPRACFGRDRLIEGVIGFAENLTPIALIGAGGIGKTSAILTVLHHDRIKERFGENRRFIRCDQFPATLAHLLTRLSEAIGAGVQNPQDLACLSPFLSSGETLIVLDNAESILDPRGKEAAKIYAMVEELSQLETLCLCITSRISTIPPGCEIVNVPTLSMDAAQDAFYRIYKGERSPLINDILEELDFHPLSINLLATVAHQNQWDTNRLAREWNERRTGVLQTERKSLAAAIELSLTSPLFQHLGPDARALLEVVAFFPQGIDENNVNWLFSMISNRTDIFDKFCTLSLTHRSNGFITMLAPLRDYLSPKDSNPPPLLRATKERYLARLSVTIDPGAPDFGETRWIISEDINIEHLLDFFTTVDANSVDIWEACTNFMTHLVWHKHRLTILKPKVEGLPDDHISKPRCLFELSRLSDTVGRQAERKQLLTQALKLVRESGNDHYTAQILRHLSDTSRRMGFPQEGVQLAKEAVEIYERLGGTVELAWCLKYLALLLCSARQLDAAEETALRAVSLSAEGGNQYQLSDCHRVLGDIYRCKGDRTKAIHHYGAALEIAFTFNWRESLFWIHLELVVVFLDDGKFDYAQAHLEQARSYAAGTAYYIGRVMTQQAFVWYEQHRLEEARSEILRAADVFTKLGSAEDMYVCSAFLSDIEKGLNSPVVANRPDSTSEPP